MKHFSLSFLLSRLIIAAMTFVFALSSQTAYAGSAREINASYETALDILKRESLGAEDALKKAKGILVIPGMWKFGLGLGGEYGEGALKVGGSFVDYYSMIGLSLGWQVGIQKHTVILAFMDDDILKKFQSSSGWEFGLDGSATLIAVGIDGDITTLTHNEPILAFVIDQKGLMVNLTLEGYKLTKIKK